jgi:hypothetical protein
MPLDRVRPEIAESLWEHAIPGCRDRPVGYQGSALMSRGILHKAADSVLQMRR